MALEITQERFFKIGVWCFLIIGLMNIGIFIENYKYLNFYSITSSWASIIFNFALSGFFYYLLKQTSPQIEEEYASEDIKELLQEVKKQNAKHTRTKEKIKRIKLSA